MTDNTARDPESEIDTQRAALMTPDEVDEVSKHVASKLFDDPSQAGIIAAVMARRMNAAKTRGAQDQAGARVLETFAELARGPS